MTKSIDTNIEHSLWAMSALIHFCPVIKIREALKCPSAINGMW